MTKRGAIAAACALFLVACSDDDEICSDGQDNDDNALVDCEDPACGPGAGCGPHGLVCAASLTCSSCSGNGGVVEPAGEATCGDGVDNDCDGLVDCADPQCQPSGAEPGKLCDATGRRCSVADAAGASSCGGQGGGAVPGTQGAIGEIRLAQAEHQVLGAFGSGYREQSLLTFEVVAADGTPYAGVPVAFSHESQAGSFIGPVATCTPRTATSPSICTAEGMTDGDGRVGVVLRSGTRAAVMSVRADATAAGVTRRLVAGGFAVVGAKPSGARFSLDCRPYNVPAYTTHDCLYSRYKGAAREVDCTATLGDRHDNLVAVPTLVAFQSEAGLVVPGAFTPSFDPTQSGAGLGQAVGKLDVYGAPLPFDVEPFPWEHSLEEYDFGCGKRTVNPRDGLVSVIALVQGEEGFVDANLNGVFDDDEPWIDLGEPFLDVDDDGVWSAGEWYLDLDENLAYSPPNGRWDADTVLWTQARVLYTGYPEFGSVAVGGATNELFTRLYVSGAPPAPTRTPQPFPGDTGLPAGPWFFDVFFTDQFFNPLSSFSTFGAEALVGNVTAKLSPVTGTADSLATTFRMLYCGDPALPSTCRDGPADQGCRTSPCYLRTEVGAAFAYGNHALLAISCEEPGPDVVQVSATIENVSSVFSISGGCAP